MLWISVFQLLAFFHFGHPSRSSGSTAAPRCLNPFTNTDTYVLDLLACLSVFVASLDRFSTTIIIGLSVLPETSSSVTVCVLAAQAVPILWPLRLVETHQHVQVWAPALLPQNHVVVAIPRLACECLRILRTRSHIRSGLGTQDRVALPLVPHGLRCTRYNHLCVSKVAILRLVASGIVSGWVLVLLTWGFVDATLPLERWVLSL